MKNRLDAIIARLSTMQGWNIYALDKGKMVPWQDVEPREVIDSLIIHEVNLQEQVQVIAALIMHWGRMAAHTKRAWEQAERNYRTWRDGAYLKMALNPGEDGWKKPSDKIIDAQIRTHVQYTKYYREMERAEEAHNSTNAVLDGFRAKKDLMKAAIIRSNEDSAPRLSV